MKCLYSRIVSKWPQKTPFRYILRANNAYVVFLGKIRENKQELSHDSIARLNCALPITKTISVIR